MKPYNSVDSKQEQIEEMFDTIAPHYDLLNKIMSLGIDRRWRRKVVRMVSRGLEPEGTAPQLLDLATGTGDMAILLARKVTGSMVTGADLSEGMLKLAATKIEKQCLSDRIGLRQAAAEQLPFADNSYHAATVAFGVRNFEDIPQGMREISRVLKRGGKAYVLEISKPRNKMLRGLYNLYFHSVPPLVGGAISGDRKAYTYLPESVDEFPHGESFEAIMKDNGFTDVSSKGLMFGVVRIYKGTKN